MRPADVRAFGSAALVLAAVVLVGSGCPLVGNSEEVEWSETFSADDFGWVLSVAGRSSDRVYAVGGEPDAGAVKRYDGSEWKDVSIPSDVSLLTWVHCFEDGKPVMAGNGGTVLWRRDGGWEVDELPTDQNLWGIWGASRDDVWTVGGNGTPTDGEPVIFRYDGSEWRSVTVPDLAHDRVYALFKVWGSGPDDVYIVGGNGTILRWNGSELVDESPDTRRDFITVWGSGRDRVAAVGSRVENGILALREEGSWTVHSIDVLGAAFGVWVPNSDTAWVSGAEADGDGKVVRVDLSADEPTTTVQPFEADVGLHAIYGLSETELYSVGANLERAGGPYHGASWRGSAGN